MMTMEAAFMAESWRVDPSDVRHDTKLTRWVERQMEFIEDMFSLDLNLDEIDIFEAPPTRFGAVMSTGGLSGEPITVVFISSDAPTRYEPAALHYVVRHEVAHIVDRQERGTSDESSPEFRAVCQRLNAPLSGAATGRSGYAVAHEYAEAAPPDVHDYASKGL